MRRTALLLLVACNQYQGKPGLDDTRPASEDSPEDSLDCTPCDLATNPAVESQMADVTCLAAADPVVDPYEIEVKLELGVAGNYSASYNTRPVVGDVSGDGQPDIVMQETDSLDQDSTVVYSATGGVEWRGCSLESEVTLLVDADGVDGAEVLSQYCERPDDDPEHYTDPFVGVKNGAGDEVWRLPRGESWPSGDAADVADLAGVGHPVILHEQQLFDLATGAQVGSLDAADDPIYSAAFADADGDGTLEIASQGSLFEASGRVLWTIPDPPGRTCSVALQADDDDLPEFLFLEQGWWLVDSDGSELMTVPAPGNGTGLVLADFDGDGAPDIVTWNGEATAVYHLDGTLLWEAADWAVGPFGWDFDADGASELVVIGEGALRILDGRTGAVLYELDIVVSGDWFPLVADIDGDGHAELIIPGGTPRDGDTPQLTVLHQVNDTWPAAGPSWPVRDFQISNVGPAGEIPRGETNPPWWAYNTYHARPAADPAGVNLSPAVVATCADTCTGMTQLQVQVTNSGPAASGAAVVQLQRDGAALGEATVDAIEPGWTSAGVILSLPTADLDAGGVTVVVDPAGLVDECHEDDNEVGVGSGR